MSSSRRSDATRPTVQVQLNIGRDGLDSDWRNDALCATGRWPLDLWFPKRAANGHRIDYRPAQDVCAMCPSRTPCADYAIANGETTGVYGGLTPLDRERLATRRTIGGAA